MFRFRQFNILLHCTDTMLINETQLIDLIVGVTTVTEGETVLLLLTVNITITDN